MPPVAAGLLATFVLLSVVLVARPAAATFLLSSSPDDRKVTTVVRSSYQPFGGVLDGPGSAFKGQTILLPVATIDDTGTSTSPDAGPGTSSMTAAFDSVLNDDKTNFSATLSFDAASVGRCLAKRQACNGEALYSIEHPRARALLRVAGVTPATESCLLDRGGDDESLGDVAAGKAIGKCSKGIAKAGAAFTAARLKIVTKCANKIYGCVQTKPDDDTCIPKVKAACDKDLVKLGGTRATLAAGLSKACGAVPFGAILGASGLDAGDLQAFCDGYGGALGSLADYADCIARHHTCVVKYAALVGLPRTPELLDAVGQSLFSDFCAS